MTRYHPRHKRRRDIAGPVGQALMLAWFAAAAVIPPYALVSVVAAAATRRLP